MYREKMWKVICWIAATLFLSSTDKDILLFLSNPLFAFSFCCSIEIEIFFQRYVYTLKSNRNCTNVLASLYIYIFLFSTAHWEIYSLFVNLYFALIASDAARSILEKGVMFVNIANHYLKFI